MTDWLNKWFGWFVCLVAGHQFVAPDSEGKDCPVCTRCGKKRP